MLLVLSSPFFSDFRAHIAELAIQQRLPIMFIFKSFVQAGGLISQPSDFRHDSVASAVAEARTVLSSPPSRQNTRSDFRPACDSVGVKRGRTGIHLLMNHSLPGVNAGYITQDKLLSDPLVIHDCHREDWRKRNRPRMLQAGDVDG